MAPAADPVVAVIGSREWPKPGVVVEFVEKLAAKYPAAVVVSGGARGADREAETAALQLGLELISYRPCPCEELIGARRVDRFSVETITVGERAALLAFKRTIKPPTFATYGQAAFFRNNWIAQDCDVLVAFHHYRSPGTARTIKVAREFGRRAFVYESEA